MNAMSESHLRSSASICGSEMRRQSSAGELLAQHVRRRDFIAEFLVSFVDSNGSARARRKPAVGVERDTLRGEKFHSLPHTIGDDLCGIDLTGCDADTAKPDLKIFAELLEHSHVTS